MLSGRFFEKYPADFFNPDFVGIEPCLRDADQAGQKAPNA
jgi:hypothetical protein